MLTLTQSREISTHSGNGESQLRENDQGLIYTNYGPHVPTDHASDTQRAGIWITLDSPKHTLHPASRVNYAQLFNIDHNLKVQSYGTMDDHSLSILLRQWKQISIQMYRPDPGALAKAVQEPSTQSLSNLDFTPTQVKTILEVIDNGTEPRSAITEVARNKTVGQLGSEALADMVSDSVSEGLGYTAAASRERYRDGSSEVLHLDQTQDGAKSNDLDVDVKIGANDDPKLVSWTLITKLVRRIFQDTTLDQASSIELQQDIGLSFVYNMLSGRLA